MMLMLGYYGKAGGGGEGGLCSSPGWCLGVRQAGPTGISEMQRGSSGSFPGEAGGPGAQSEASGLT